MYNVYFDMCVLYLSVSKHVFLVASASSQLLSLSLFTLPHYFGLPVSSVLPAQVSFSTRTSFIHASGPSMPFSASCQEVLFKN